MVFALAEPMMYGLAGVLSHDFDGTEPSHAMMNSAEPVERGSRSRRFLAVHKVCKRLR
jgi:hypothetical protein